MPVAKKSEIKIKKQAAAPIKPKVKKAKVNDVLAKEVSVKEKPGTPIKKVSKLSADVYDLEGVVFEKITLAEEIFGANINKALITQAVRVFRANQRLGTASTKTRGEVEGSSRKIYRQKGTGRARHGSIRAPIFVHGGIVGGPKPRDYSLHLPQKMKRAALFSALSDKFKSGKIKILGGIEKIEPKTKKFISVIDKLGLNDKKKKILIIIASGAENLKRAAGNVQGVSITGAKRLNTYDILSSQQILFIKEAVQELENHFLKKDKEIKSKIKIKTQ